MYNMEQSNIRNKEMLRFIKSVGFRQVVFDANGVSYEHRDMFSLLLYLFPKYDKAQLIFEGNYEAPLYSGSIRDSEFKPILKETLQQILD